MTLQAQYTSTTTAFRLTATPASGVALPLTDPSKLGVRPLGVYLQATTANIRFTADGVTTPTASVGAVLTAGANPWLYSGDLISLQFIRESAGAVLNVIYAQNPIAQGATGAVGPQGVQGPTGASGGSPFTAPFVVNSANEEYVRLGGVAAPSFDSTQMAPNEVTMLGIAPLLDNSRVISAPQSDGFAGSTFTFAFITQAGDVNSSGGDPLLANRLSYLGELYMDYEDTTDPDTVHFGIICTNLIGHEVFSVNSASDVGIGLCIPDFHTAPVDVSNSNLFIDGATGRAVFKGAVVIARITAPADGDLAANQCALYFDPTNGAAKLMAKGKQADGTVVGPVVVKAF